MPATPREKRQAATNYSVTPKAQQTPLSDRRERQKKPIDAIDLNEVRESRKKTDDGRRFHSLTPFIKNDLIYCSVLYRGTTKACSCRASVALVTLGETNRAGSDSLRG